jgi:glycosyltransferase involved in cell wall biosynthesis
VIAALQRVKYLRTAITEACYWPLLLRELRRADVVHVFSASYFSFLLAPWPAVQVARLLRKPVVMNYHSGEAPDHLARSAVARRTLAAAEVNVVPSLFLKDVFSGFGIEAAVIPNIVDLDRFAFRPRPAPRPRLVSTRNLEPLYNVACTLRAFAEVQARYPDATLTLVGGGSEEPRLRSLARELGVRAVTFTGRMPAGEIWRAYADADIYVQTPNIDNKPLSVLEAYASGLPVVSTDAGGVPAILTHGAHGLLTPPDDHRAVAAAIFRLLEEPGLSLRLTEAARERCAACTWGNVRGAWLAAYHRALRAPAGAQHAIPVS